MSKNTSNNETRVDALKNESTRQRWDLFHRAIAHAKQSTTSALEESSKSESENGRTVPLQGT